MKEPLVRSWFSYGYGNRASWTGGDGWAETCAWALRYGAPTQRSVCLGANKKYKANRAPVLQRAGESVNRPRAPGAVAGLLRVAAEIAARATALTLILNPNIQVDAC